MVARLDTVRGYAALWNSTSRNFAGPRDRSPRFERVPPGALTVAPTLYFDAHHLGAINAFAFAHDGSARAWPDAHGLAFEGELPATRAGADVLNGLRSCLALGVSVEMGDLQYEPSPRDGVYIVQSATVRPISIVKPDAAIYPDAVCRLATAATGSLPARAEDARRRWREPSPQRAVLASATARRPQFFDVAALMARLPTPRRRVA
jgi:hypothetical protein